MSVSRDSTANNSVLDLICNLSLVLTLAKIGEGERTELISMVYQQFDEKLSTLQSYLGRPVETYSGIVKELMVFISILGRISNLFTDNVNEGRILAKNIVEKLISILSLITPERRTLINSVLAELYFKRLIFRVKGVFGTLCLFVNWMSKYQQTIASDPQETINFQTSIFQRSLELAIYGLHLSVSDC
jgi:hypothetical protein